MAERLYYGLPAKEGLRLRNNFNKGVWFMEVKEWTYEEIPEFTEEVEKIDFGGY